MSAVVPLTKTCPRCGTEKPLSEFHRQANTADGRYSWCRTCANEYTRTWQAEARERMGDEAFRAHQTENVRRSRRKPEVRERGRKSTAAYRAALNRLRDLHRNEFDRLLAIERYERGLS